MESKFTLYGPVASLLHTLASIQLVYSEYLPVLQLIALILQYNLQVLKKFRERFEN